MKADYISRDDILNEIHRFHGYIDEDMEYRMKLAINKIPSADVAEVRHGKWLWELGGNGWANHICSECGYTKTQISIVVMNYEYCPHCGARMKDEA